MSSDAKFSPAADPVAVPFQARSSDHGTAQTSRPLPKRSAVVVDLLEGLERAGIPYVHWKSNVRLEDSLCGVEDLDLLVHPRDAESFLQAVIGSGFKMAVSRWGAGHPGVFHALAWDAELGRIIDLHAYHQLISGDSFAKSYRFPVEENLLANSALLLGFSVTDPSAELGLFLIRTLLKHTSLVELNKVNRSLAQSRAELAWLLERTDIDRTEHWCRENLPALPCSVQHLADGVAKGSKIRRVILGLRVAWALRSLRRIGLLGAFTSRAVRATRHFAARIRKRRTLSLLSGGSWIAFVGPKGTGKSTLAALVARGIGAKLDVRVVHLGKPPPGWLSALPKLLSPLLRRLLPGERLEEYERPERRSERHFSILFVVRKLLLAHDRRRLLTSCMRDMASGTLIVSDRCPATNFSGLDGSAFDDAAVARADSSLKRWLMIRERAIYRDMPRPTLVVKLEAPLELAIERDCHRRKPGGPDAAAIKRRWGLEREAEFAHSRVLPVFTGGSVEDTYRLVGAEVWDAI